MRIQSSSMKGIEKLDALATAAGAKQNEREPSGEPKDLDGLNNQAPPASCAGSQTQTLATKKPAVIFPKQNEGIPSPAQPQAALSQQQLVQNAMTTAALGGINNQVAAAFLQNQGAVAAAALNQQQTDHAALAVVQQQLAYYQYVQALAAQQQTQNQQIRAPLPVASPAITQLGGKTVSFQTQDVVAPTKNIGNQQQPQRANNKNSMQPPPPPSQSTQAVTGISPGGLLAVKRAASQVLPSLKPSSGTDVSAMAGPYDDKKQLKRAANRRSAQLSRKRKKLYIEELKEENDELRRKEEILRSLPDLVVVFDSAGKVWFVSHSVSRFLDYTPADLEGTSFWDRLCEESVRLLKAAFMDALAAHRPDNSDTTPLGSGCWELRLVDRDGSQKIITMNGVVHFTKDTPECVCSIRPREDRTAEVAITTSDKSSIPTLRNVSINTSSNGSASSSDAASSSATSMVRPLPRTRPHIKPHQSVMVSSDSSVAHSNSNNKSNKVKRPGQEMREEKARRRPPSHQISDGDADGSVISSESGSDE